MDIETETVQTEENEQPIVRDKRTARYFVVDNFFMDTYGPLVKPIGVAVYCALLRFSRPDGAGGWPTHATIARLAGTNVSTAKRTLRVLEDYGLISINQRWRTNRGQTSNEYLILEPPQVPIKAPRIAKESTTRTRKKPTKPGGGDHSDPGVASDLGGGDAGDLGGGL